MHIKMLALAISDLLIVVVNAGSVGNWLRFKVSMGKYSNILDRAISDLCEGDGKAGKGLALLIILKYVRMLSFATC